MIYRIQWGRIAAVQEVSCPEGRYDCIYYNADIVQAFFKNNLRFNVWSELPEQIQKRIKARFKPMFDAPPEQRQFLIDASETEDISIED